MSLRETDRHLVRQGQMNKWQKFQSYTTVHHVSFFWGVPNGGSEGRMLNGTAVRRWAGRKMDFVRSRKVYIMRILCDVAHKNVMRHFHISLEMGGSFSGRKRRRRSGSGWFAII